MDEEQQVSLSEVGLTAESSQEGCITVTCESFGEGVEYVGFMMQIVVATVVAIVALIAFYLLQQSLKKRKEPKI